MNIQSNTAEIVYQNFKTLPRKQQSNFIRLLLNDKKYEKDLIDIAIIKQRLDEPSISLEEYLNKSKKQQNEL